MALILYRCKSDNIMHKLTIIDLNGIIERDNAKNMNKRE